MGCADCGQVSGALCGNGLCEAGDGENCATCPEDCGGRQKGGQQNQFCCGFDDGQVTNPIGCGVDANDNRCIDSADGLACRVTARLSACCGDAMCDGQEQVQGADYCQVDCEACSPTGTSEAVCNGVDDDCDSIVDEDYVESPTSCGVGVCAASGNTTCSGGVEGDNCTPGDPTEPGSEVSCTDGLDNDCDGLSDANDPDCQVCVPDETPEASCFDGSDNDCDEQIDCADTADCDGALGAPTTCGVGACESTGNLSCSGGAETDTCTPGAPGVEGPNGDATCSDGIDNDCDGQTDAADADCAGAVVCADITVDNGGKSACNNEPTCEWIGSPKSGFCQDAGGTTTENVCDDGIDNDNDGATDCNDGDCAGDPACQTGACDNDGVCDPGEDCNSCASDCDGVTGGKPANRFCCGNGVQEGPEGDGAICDGNF
jgi:hypothetical protein